ncbi:hypothetical protein Ahy_B01g055495 [Arachis hypogaea]|uniref:Aminotransferase-like plant mobile domain-containing protein n=1 Tax=Arachis hypogaea TaxID=3818 RepID=A0A445AWD3_ARAHY|nr:hypothetical protein Ahy_B01g055495 [Arachis hypogaea]
MGDDPGRLYRLDGVVHIAGVINDEWFGLVVLYAVYVSGFARGLTSGLMSGFARSFQVRSELHWLQETFGECPEGADEETVRRYARAYIMMLLGTQLFADKSGNRIHIRWLPFVARLEEMGGYSWGSAALAWLYRCMCRVANRHVVKLAEPLQLLQSWIFWQFSGFRPVGYDAFSWPLASRWSGYNPRISEKGPRVQMARLRIDLLQAWDFIWMPYSTPDVLQVVHPEVLEPRHTMLWRCVTSLIYFAVVEWHQVDRVLPQFGSVQPPPHPALNIDFLMSKDGRGGDRWFPSYLQHWHLHWETRADHVLRFDVVADPGPSHEFLAWWHQHGKRFLSPEMYLGIREGRWSTRRAWRQEKGAAPRQDMPDRGDHAAERGAPVEGVRPAHGGHGGEWYGSDMGDPSSHADTGLGEGPLGDYSVGVPVDDQTPQENTPWVIPGSMFSEFLAGDGIDVDFGGSHFLDEITTIMQEDEAARRRGQTTGT